MSYINLHPDINNGFTKGDPNFSGGTLQCHCRSDPVKVQITGNVAHNHACGCSKCWKPDGALFSIVGVVPVDNVKVVANANKLSIIDPNAAIQRNACKQCGVHLYGRIVKDHAFKGLDFIHVELSKEQGWQEPQFAAFVSSIIEQGFDAGKMDQVRSKLKSVGLEPYDCLNPGLMDALASYTAKSKCMTMNSTFGEILTLNADEPFQRSILQFGPIRVDQIARTNSATGYLAVREVEFA